MRPGARWLGLALAAFAGMVVAVVLIGPRLGGTSGSRSFVPSASASASASASHDGSPTAVPSLSSSPTPLPNHVSLPLPTWDPGVGTLVLRLWMEAPLRTHVLTLLDDGHLVMTSYMYGAPEGPNEGSSVERRLTAAGVQLVRDELEAAGLTFSSSADYFPEGPLDGTPASLEVARSGSGTAVINWRSGAVGPEVEALRALESRLLTLEDRLPASAWADANARPYAAARYVIFIRSIPWGGSLDDLPVESDTVSWPLDNGIDDYGDAVEMVNQEGDANDEGPGRCRVVSVEEAAPVVEALDAAGATLDDPRNGIRFSLGARAAGRLITISFVPILPLAETSCALEMPF